MKLSRRTGLPVIAIAALVLSGCATPAAVVPTPTATPIDKSTWIGQVIDPVGTTWSGTDSAGDLTTFLLQGDSTVEVTFGANKFDESGDTWKVIAGALSLHIHLNSTDGYLDYAGPYDPASGTIAGTGTTTLTSRTVTVTLAKA